MLSFLEKNSFWCASALLVLGIAIYGSVEDARKFAFVVALFWIYCLFVGLIVRKLVPMIFGDRFKSLPEERRKRVEGASALIAFLTSAMVILECLNLLAEYEIASLIPKGTSTSISELLWFFIICGGLWIWATKSSLPIGNKENERRG